MAHKKNAVRYVYNSVAIKIIRIRIEVDGVLVHVSLYDVFGAACLFRVSDSPQLNL